MRIIAILALLIALVAAAFAVLAYQSAAASRQMISDLITEQANSTSDIAKRIGQLRQRLDEAGVGAHGGGAVVQTTSPAPTASGAAPVPAGAAAQVATLDEAKVKEIVVAEMQAQMQRMRQQWGGGGQRGPTIGDAASVKAQLGVTDDHKAEQAAAIIGDMRTAMRDAWRNNQGDRDASMKAMQEARTAAETKLADVLSPEELAKLKQILDQQGGRRGGGDRGGPGPGGPGPGPGGDQPAPAEPPKGASF